MEERSSGNSKERANSRSITQPLIWWFVLALMALVASQVMRLHQHQALSWLLWDYAGRIAALTILAAVPSARIAAFRTGERQISLFEIVLWIVGICLLDRFVQLPQSLLNAAFPTTVLGAYPQPTGWLKAFDLFFGLALVLSAKKSYFADTSG
ncbi:hypothetical protein [Bradyrhizobium japonicum]|uniref:hypothetical protein n=1 Tax=Bradyrhizobium japonicum TaxID=375 RepID=UPI001E33285C|nr:hypothetical protein [Bradyrhizobium japonicum]MCD9111105.1 hypothetical protein [Bradyrhizobium japonicum]MCD9256516.1 hypothetical protein [Bradyrhizobium japonicum SEMIA 5079]MCD9823982.1 hypothetical protein [Bradyrhizobium japonicum]MCD9896277.1 hypothetical protein [Bradyrhizobium japonicum]MCD9911597.1 hypothetical protein [Bradyrhizobium japonicum]